MGSIRLLLAIGVILGHTSYIFGFSPVNGDTAVQCFYIVSGFYMSLILRTKYTTSKSNTLFYTNRLLKIYPIYWVTLLLGVVWGLIVFKLGYPGVFNHISKSWPLAWDSFTYLLFANIFLLTLDWIFFLSIDSQGSLRFVENFNAEDPKLYMFSVNSIAWTVGLELMFYLVAPFILRRGWKLLVFLLLASFALRLYFVFTGMDIAPYNYMFFPTQIMFFMAGALSYRLYEKINFKKISKKVLIGIYSLLLLIVLFYSYSPLPAYGMQAILYLTTSLAVPFVFELFKTSRIDRFLGDLSYPMYITQALVIQITIANSFPKIFGWGFTTVAIGFVLSITLHFFLQIPIEKIRQKRVKFSKIVEGKDTDRIGNSPIIERAPQKISVEET